MFCFPIFSSAVKTPQLAVVPHGSTSESSNAMYKTEETAYYYFYKILSNTQYSIGKELSEFMADFCSGFLEEKQGVVLPPFQQGMMGAEKNCVISSSIPLSRAVLPARSATKSAYMIMGEITKVSSQLESNYFFLKNPSVDLVSRVRPSVERYIFEKLGHWLFFHYRMLFEKSDKEYESKVNAIRRNAGEDPNHTIATTCGVRKEFLYVSFSKSISLMNQLQVSFDRVVSSPGACCTTPAQLVQLLLSILISIKTEVLSYSGGQKELQSMDDIAPIFLFVCVSAEELVTPVALHQLLYDCMSSEQRMETEGKAVTLLEGASRIVTLDF